MNNTITPPQETHAHSLNGNVLVDESDWLLDYFNQNDSEYERSVAKNIILDVGHAEENIFCRDGLIRDDDLGLYGIARNVGDYNVEQQAPDGVAASMRDFIVRHQGQFTPHTATDLMTEACHSTYNTLGERFRSDIDPAQLPKIAIAASAMHIFTSAEDGKTYAAFWNIGEAAPIMHDGTHTRVLTGTPRLFNKDSGAFNTGIVELKPGQRLVFCNNPGDQLHASPALHATTSQPKTTRAQKSADDLIKKIEGNEARYGGDKLAMVIDAKETGASDPSKSLGERARQSWRTLRQAWTRINTPVAILAAGMHGRATEKMTDIFQTERKHRRTGRIASFLGASAIFGLSAYASLKGVQNFFDPPLSHVIVVPETAHTIMQVANQPQFQAPDIPPQFMYPMPGTEATVAIRHVAVK